MGREIEREGRVLGILTPLCKKDYWTVWYWLLLVLFSRIFFSFILLSINLCFTHSNAFTSKFPLVNKIIRTRYKCFLLRDNKGKEQSLSLYNRSSYTTLKYFNWDWSWHSLFYVNSLLNCRSPVLMYFARPDNQRTPAAKCF